MKEIEEDSVVKAGKAAVTNSTGIEDMVENGGAGLTERNARKSKKGKK